MATTNSATIGLFLFSTAAPQSTTDRGILLWQFVFFLFMKAICLLNTQVM